MKVIVLRAHVREGLSAIERAEGSIQGLPALRNVLVEAENNSIRLVATNLEIAATYLVPGKVLEAGRVAIPLSVFTGVISNLQTERLNLEKRGSGLEVKSDNYQAALQGTSPEEFPLIPKIQNTKEFISIKTSLFKDALGQVIVATQPSDLRPELNSVLLGFSLDALKFAATDSFRLAEKTLSATNLESSHKEGFRVLIPLKTAQELLRALKDEDTLRIYHDDNQILFKTEQFELISRLIEGTFPDYAAIIPSKFSAEVVVDRQEFMNALKLASIFGTRSSEVKLAVPTGKKVLDVSSADQVVGENSYLLPAKISGKPGEIVFNWRYVLDALKALKGDEVFFGINENEEPSLLRSSKDSSYFYILKPIIKT